MTESRNTRSVTEYLRGELEAFYPAPSDWSAAANAIVFRIFRPETSQDLFLLRLDDDGPPTAIADGEANEQSGVISPDGRWIAYGSARQGRSEILVTPIGGG